MYCVCSMKSVWLLAVARGLLPKREPGRELLHTDDGRAGGGLPCAVAGDVRQHQRQPHHQLQQRLPLLDQSGESSFN